MKSLIHLVQDDPNTYGQKLSKHISFRTTYQLCEIWYI